MQPAQSRGENRGCDALVAKCLCGALAAGFAGNQTVSRLIAAPSVVTRASQPFKQPHTLPHLRLACIAPPELCSRNHFL